MGRVVLLVAVAFLLVGWARPGPGRSFLTSTWTRPSGGGFDQLCRGANPLVGNGLSVDSVRRAIHAAEQPLKLGLTDGLLNFQTGNLTGSNAGHWFFGGRDDQHHHVVTGRLGRSNTLLPGSFSSAEVNMSSASSRLSSQLTSTAWMTSSQPTSGSPGLPWEGNLDLSFDATGDSQCLPKRPGPSGDVTTSPIPEPSSLLMGSIGVVGWPLPVPTPECLEKMRVRSDIERRHRASRVLLGLLRADDSREDLVPVAAEIPDRPAVASRPEAGNPSGSGTATLPRSSAVGESRRVGSRARSGARSALSRPPRPSRRRRKVEPGVRTQGSAKIRMVPSVWTSVMSTPLRPMSSTRHALRQVLDVDRDSPLEPA